LRRELWDAGVRVESGEAHGYRLDESSADPHRFPADNKLSADVKERGRMVAWAPRYLVRNLGHSVDELRKRSDYYGQNYRSKPWLGEDGLATRLRTWELAWKPDRRSFLFPAEVAMPEKTEPHTECPHPQRWSMIDGWTAEIEVLEMLHALVRLIKPDMVVETGTWRGYAAIAMGQALRSNGGGRLITLEIDPFACEAARERITEAGLSEIVSVENIASLAFAPAEPIDLLLLDSDVGLRAQEFRHFRPFLRERALVVVHDTSPLQPSVRAAVEELETAGELTPLLLRSARGLAICVYEAASSAGAVGTRRARISRLTSRVLRLRARGLRTRVRRDRRAKFAPTRVSSQSSD
jgi:predicted O-methyltransferase YrrM